MSDPKKRRQVVNDSVKKEPVDKPQSAKDTIDIAKGLDAKAAVVDPNKNQGKQDEVHTQIVDDIVENQVNENEKIADDFPKDPLMDEAVLELIKQNDENEAQMAEMTKQMEEMDKEVNEMREQFMRARADLENFRRRARKEKEDAIKYAKVPLLESLLPVLDNFERALDASDKTKVKSPDALAIHQGIEMVYRQFLQVLHEQGLEMIDALGKPFNPYEHEAVMKVDTDQFEPGIVVEEVQAGYRYQDRVIRPAMVKVSN